MPNVVMLIVVMLSVEVLIHVMIQRRREILDSWLYFLLENVNHM